LDRYKKNRALSKILLATKAMQKWTNPRENKKRREEVRLAIALDSAAGEFSSNPPSKLNRVNSFSSTSTTTIYMESAASPRRRKSPQKNNKSGGSNTVGRSVRLSSRRGRSTELLTPRSATKGSCSSSSRLRKATRLKLAEVLRRGQPLGVSSHL